MNSADGGMKSLPGFIPPMLAVHGQPFDSDAHFFEFKWDGFRAIAMIEHGSVRLMSRNGNDLIQRFPRLSSLRALPQGLALDGEIVAFSDGKPDFDALIDHEGRRPHAIRFVAFDLLYEGFDSRMELSFRERRSLLERVSGGAACAELFLSEGMPSNGMALYRRASEQGLEGVMAKRLNSPYAAGKRNGAWIKIKRRLRVQAAIIGYIEKPSNDFQSLLVAGNGIPGENPGPLRYLGRVGTGFTDAVRARINGLLRAHPRKTPLVPCAEPGRWVEPGLYCEVSFAELTEAGVLRAPVFEGLIEQ